MFYDFKTREILNLFRSNDPEVKTNVNNPEAETEINAVSVFPNLPIFMDNYRPCQIDAKNAIAFAAVKIKKYYDSKYQAKFFKIGDFINLRFHQNYQLPSIKYPKINFQFAGPFKMVKRIGKLTYRFEFPENMKIHDVIFIAYFEPATDFVQNLYHRYRQFPPVVIINNQ